MSHKLFSKKILIKLRILIFLLITKKWQSLEWESLGSGYISVGSSDCRCFPLNAVLAQICWSLFFSSSSVCFWTTQAGDKRLSHIRLKQLPAVLFERGHFRPHCCFTPRPWDIVTRMQFKLHPQVDARVVSVPFWSAGDITVPCSSAKPLTKAKNPFCMWHEPSIVPWEPPSPDG